MTMPPQSGSPHRVVTTTFGEEIIRHDHSPIGTPLTDEPTTEAAE